MSREKKVEKETEQENRYHVSVCACACQWQNTTQTHFVFAHFQFQLFSLCSTQLLITCMNSIRCSYKIKSIDNFSHIFQTHNNGCEKFAEPKSNQNKQTNEKKWNEWEWRRKHERKRTTRRREKEVLRKEFYLTEIRFCVLFGMAFSLFRCAFRLNELIGRSFPSWWDFYVIICNKSTLYEYHWINMMVVLRVAIGKNERDERTKAMSKKQNARKNKLKNFSSTAPRVSRAYEDFIWVKLFPSLHFKYFSAKNMNKDFGSFCFIVSCLSHWIAITSRS